MTARQEWAERVEAWRASGETLQQFAEGQPYAASSLRWWEGQLRREAKAGSTAAPRGRRSAGSTALAPAGIELHRVVPRPTESPVVVELGRARIAVRRGFDAKVLLEVFRALRDDVGAEK